MAAHTNNKISQINIPSSVKQIEWEAFANCTNLETVIFNEGLETIGTHIFNKNTKIKSSYDAKTFYARRIIIPKQLHNPDLYVYICEVRTT